MTPRRDHHRGSVSGHPFRLQLRPGLMFRGNILMRSVVRQSLAGYSAEAFGFLPEPEWMPPNRASVRRGRGSIRPFTIRRHIRLRLPSRYGRQGRS
jgi:hypothetical protein